MIDKGYEDPLYSFDLVRGLASTSRRWSIAVPQGRLVVPVHLHTVGRRTTTQRCQSAVQAGLAAHALHVDAFAAYGLDQAWGEHMRRWCDRLDAQDGRLAQVRSDQQVASSSRRALGEQARRLWRRLVLCAELSGHGSRVAVGRPPTGRLQLIAALTRALERVDDHQAALAQYGFGPAQRQELLLLLEGVRRSYEQRALGSDQVRGHSDAVVVMRAALLGDLRRLVHVAPIVLHPEQAAGLRMGRLIPQWREAPAADAP